MCVIISFVAIITYGQWVSYGVVEEKGNRIIETILATTKPSQILWAKILSIGSLGLVQFLLIIGISVGLGKAMDEIALPDIAAATGAWFVLWFILGYGLYAALFASAGSLASSSQEASNTVTPIVIVPMIGYFAAIPDARPGDPSPGVEDHGVRSPVVTAPRTGDAGPRVDQSARGRPRGAPRRHLGLAGSPARGRASTPVG